MFTEKLGMLPDQLNDFVPYRDGEILLKETADKLISRGEYFLNYSYPPIPATLYMDFYRTGNRVRFEDRYMARRRALNALAMAEFAEKKGRFLNDIINGIFALCEESGWQLPAHNCYVRNTPQQILPNKGLPVLDLFACETGAQLAMVRLLLKDSLDAVSPVICNRMLHEINQRIVAPYLNHHFWWMGNGEEPMCNWTAWCTQNILLAVFSTNQTQDIKNRTVRQAAYSLDCFLKDYGEDGCCDEGAQYYRHAGLCLFNAMEVLNRVTGDLFSPLYQEQKIKNIAAYILNMHVYDRYYINFSDCSPIAGRAGVREFLFAKRVQNPNLMAFAAEEWKKSDNHDLPEEINLFYKLQAAFTAEEISRFQPSTPLSHSEIYYPSTGVFVARDNIYCLAVKAGNNNDNHNHNDTGSFTIYKYGQPFLIDVGVESYTKKTFSEHRYEIWTMQSAYHNLPSFHGIMQKEGASYGARNVKTVFQKEKSGISMDIAGAYPPEANVTEYLRRAELVKGKEILIEDRFSGSCTEAVLNLMLCKEPHIKKQVITVDGIGTITASSGEITVEKISVSDPRLRTAWPEFLWRVLISFKNNIILNIK